MTRTPSGRIEFATILIIAVALAAALGLWWAARWFAPEPAQPLSAVPKARSDLEHAVLYPKPRELPSFEFERGDGGRFTQADLSGRWSLLFFGFTTCPDVCPTTLGELRRVERALHAKDPTRSLQVLFVSVDPERDTAEKLAAYVRFFGPEFIGLRADLDRLEPFTRRLGIVFVKTPTGPGPFDYTIDHSASILIVDPSGRLIGLFRPPHRTEAMVRDLERLLEGP